jgi:hypothetical protein
MRLDHRPIARRTFVATAMSMVLAACGGSDATTGEGASRTPAATTEPTGQVDPIEGKWRADFTCKDSLRVIETRLSPKQIREQVGSLGSFIEGQGWGAEPTGDDPCHGATQTVAALVRFANGDLALVDPETGEGVQATYELVDDHTILVNDTSGNLCPCPGTWGFEITGDEVTFRVEPDIFIIATWEAAPFHRVS